LLAVVEIVYVKGRLCAENHSCFAVTDRLNARDRLAVEEWIESGLGVHVLRDHVNHCIAMNGSFLRGLDVHASERAL